VIRRVAIAEISEHCSQALERGKQIVQGKSASGTPSARHQIGADIPFAESAPRNTLKDKESQGRLSTKCYIDMFHGSP